MSELFYEQKIYDYAYYYNQTFIQCFKKVILLTKEKKFRLMTYLGSRVPAFIRDLIL